MRYRFCRRIFWTLGNLFEDISRDKGAKDVIGNKFSCGSKMQMWTVLEHLSMLLGRLIFIWINRPVLYFQFAKRSNICPIRSKICSWQNSILFSGKQQRR